MVVVELKFFVNKIKLYTFEILETQKDRQSRGGSIGTKSGMNSNPTHNKAEGSNKLLLYARGRSREAEAEAEKRKALMGKMA